jgi:hypothetical protein
VFRGEKRLDFARKDVFGLLLIDALHLALPLAIVNHRIFSAFEKHRSISLGSFILDRSSMYFAKL